ncbi:MAG: tetratricopeptide repeat protein [Terracidiphilus sp.]|nr:tetratricopeptide repeat protein [Terracidiphilus sp.]
MKQWLAVTAVAASAWCVAAGAQTQQQQPAAQPKPAQDANPFPDDASAPVIPTNLDAMPAANDAIDYGKVALADADKDPIPSPDDVRDAAPASEGSSSSSAGIDQVLQPPPEPEKKKGRHGRNDDDEGTIAAPHQETAAEDETVGAYYLQTKNWKGALSRFESALVLDPENPDVFWGLAESERHIGKLAEAKAHYQKVVDYDPDSKHGKEAGKLLKTPELANAPESSATTPAPAQPSQP